MSRTNDNMYTVRVQEIKGADISRFRPKPWEEVKCSFQGEDYVTVRYMQKKVKGHLKRIDKDHYQNLDTGDIKKYQVHSEQERLVVRRSALKRTFENLIGLIRTNFVGVDGNHQSRNSQLFITLTYAKNMTDNSLLYVDFKNFMKRLKYEYPHDYEYIAVMEPQGRGAWHVHLMLKAKDTSWLWLEKEDISRIWGHGYTTTARLKSNDVGVYYTAYFTGVLGECYNKDSSDEEIDNSSGEDVLKDEQLTELYAKMAGETLDKRHVKGGRLQLYPKGMKFYRCSRGIDKPVENQQMVFELKDIENKSVIYERVFSVDKVLPGENPGEEKVESLNKIYRATLRKKRKNDENADLKSQFVNKG